MDQLNHDYYTARAVFSRELAQRAASPNVAAIHQELASRYDSIAAGVRRSMTHPDRDAQAA